MSMLSALGTGIKRDGGRKCHKLFPDVLSTLGPTSETFICVPKLWHALTEEHSDWTIDK